MHARSRANEPLTRRIGVRVVITSTFVPALAHVGFAGRSFPALERSHISGKAADKVFVCTRKCEPNRGRMGSTTCAGDLVSDARRDREFPRRRPHNAVICTSGVTAAGIEARPALQATADGRDDAEMHLDSAAQAVGMWWRTCNRRWDPWGGASWTHTACAQNYALEHRLKH